MAPDRSRFSKVLDWLTSGQGGRISTNGNGHGEQKQGSGIIAPWIDFDAQTHPATNTQTTFFSRVDGASSRAERVSLATAYLTAAYAFAAMHYRSHKIAEAPLMVVEADPDTGDEDWLDGHPLERLLDMPSADFDMGELLIRTVLAKDEIGQSLWVVDKDGLGGPGGLQVFSGSEFEIRSTRERIRGQYIVKTSRGDQPLDPDRVILFQEPNPRDWLRGVSRLETFLAWLNLAQQTRATVEDLLRNSLWPSVIIQPDVSWNPSQEEFERYKTESEAYAAPGNRGKPLTILGGGSATTVSSRIRDILPADVLNRVESICSTVFGIPAIVLQFQVGMENSPWSQMAEARRSCYEETIEPAWREIERLLTRQLLRPIDADPTHFVRFDTTKIRALQPDRARNTEMAVQWKDIATLNERRTLVGLEPSDDPKADEIPELTAPDPLALAAATAAAAGANAPANGKPPVAPADAKSRRRNLFAALRRDQADGTEFDWQLLARRQLDDDRKAIVALAEEFLRPADGKATPFVYDYLERKADLEPGSRGRFLSGVSKYLKESSATSWTRAVEAKIGKDAADAAGVLRADLRFGFDLSREAVADYARKEAAWLVKGVTETTRGAVRDALARGLEDGLGAKALAQKIAAENAFSRERALLIARTEATRVSNGSPTETLSAVSQESGRAFTKTWVTAGDDRVRDEHVALEGETVGIDEDFSNGLPFPSEPNCRCILTFAEITT